MQGLLLKRLSAVVLLVFASQARAGPEPNFDGLWWMITFSPTLGPTFTTQERFDAGERREDGKKRRFVEATYPQLREDVARGYGETIKALARWHSADLDTLIEALRARPELFEQPEPSSYTVGKILTIAKDAGSSSPAANGAVRKSGPSKR